MQVKLKARTMAAPTTLAPRRGRPWRRLALAALLGASLAAAAAPLRAQPAASPSSPSSTASPAARGGRGAAADPRAPHFAAQALAKAWTDRVFAELLRGEMLVRKTAYAADDGLSIPTYLFAPLDTAAGPPRPVILFVHGGVHGDFGLAHLHQVRSLVREGWVVVAPEYRGSTGYGAAHYDAIDYGGLEVDDVVAARRWLRAEVPWADAERLAVVGYSHGGYIALFAVIRNPELFRVAVAHVPVAHLPTRMAVHGPGYEAIFARQPGYGGTFADNPAPYHDRSPATHARRLRTPVLVHAADNDDDVVIAENRILRDSMVAAGKDTAGLYTYREWQAPPGGHGFGVQDTPEAHEHWAETLAFLRRHLRRHE